jgi:DNA topoisomerase-3
VRPKDACDDQGRCLNRGGKQAADAMGNAASARLVKLRTERMREVAPLPFDLGTLQEVCSKKLGLGAQETLDIAQALYETHKVITYPRSDCGYLPLSQHSEAPDPRRPAPGRRGSERLMPHLEPPAPLTGVERRQGQRSPRHHPHRRRQGPGACRQTPGGLR